MSRYRLQERFGHYVLTQIDYRNSMKKRGWNYKVQLGRYLGVHTNRFINTCQDLFGPDAVWYDDNKNQGSEGRWLVKPSRDDSRCIYLYDRDQMVSIVTMLTLKYAGEPLAA